MNDGKLSDEQRKKFGAWISSKAAMIGKCPTCSDRRWALMDHFIDFPIYRGGSVVIGGGPSYPSVGIVCQNCGNTQFINAVLSGVLSEDSPANKSTVNENE